MQAQPQLYDQPAEPEAPEEDPVQQARERLVNAVAALADAADSAEVRYRKMLHELNTARAEAETLRESQKALAERLGSAIDRLRGILGE